MTETAAAREGRQARERDKCLSEYSCASVGCAVGNESAGRGRGRSRGRSAGPRRNSGYTTQTYR